MAEKPPKLLAGGNPQIAKGYGEAPVQAYIAGSPGWKRDLCARLDALITTALPEVQKAVKWNSPFYGMGGGEWFMSFHGFTRYVKVAFFRGASLDPVPPGQSKQVRFTLARQDLQFWVDGAWVVEPGTFHIWVSTDSTNGERKQFELV